LAEWLKAFVLKTNVRQDRGFESYTFRHYILYEEIFINTITSKLQI
jgi:hypothetical protein